jgi:hypothetical protein
MAGAFAESITMVFRYAVPLLLVGFALTWLLKNMPLRATSASAERDATPAPTAPGADAVPAAAAATPGVATAAPPDAAPADSERDDAPMRARDPVVVMD